MMADLDIDGSRHRVVMQISKNGFFYALDAASGKLLRAKNYTAVSWATHVDMQTGRPVEVPAARFGKTGKAVVVQPGGQGAHSWHPMAFSRRTSLLYTPIVETSRALRPIPLRSALNAQCRHRPRPAHVYEACTGRADAPRGIPPHRLGPGSTLREVWRSDCSVRWFRRALQRGRGAVFQGAQRGELAAYGIATGQKLWSTDPSDRRGPRRRREARGEWRAVTSRSSPGRHA